jgi:hypothetical protein
VKKVSRRGFLEAMGIGAAGAAMAPIVASEPEAAVIHDVVPAKPVIEAPARRTGVRTTGDPKITYSQLQAVMFATDRGYISKREAMDRYLGVRYED